MHLEKKKIKKLMGFFGLFSFLVWIPLSVLAVDSKLDVRHLRMSSGGKSMDVAILFGIVAVLVVLGIIIIIYNKFTKRNFFSPKKKAKDAILRSQLKQMAISPGNTSTLYKIGQIAELHPADLISSNEEFESAVDIVRESPERNALSHNIYTLREALGYTFSNQRNKFIKTQMLQSGQKLRAGIPHPTKNLSYVATLLNVTEDYYWINPPMIKGKAANLKNIRYLELNVFRSNDAEYRFRARIINQISKPMNAVILEHSTQIERMMKREHDRFAIELSNHFTIISSRTGEGFPKGQVGNEIKGTILDISAGGLRFSTEELNITIEIGDMAVFRLDEARINKSIQGKIVRINPKGNVTDIHLMFMNLTELNRLFINRYLENISAKKI